MEMQGDFPTLQRNNYKHPNIKAVRLQWRWQELRDRERRAQQHNRQLLQEFERAQETLREMMARNAAMKIIRMEYERYLDESSPCWQQQLKDESAQKKKMEKHLKECLKRMEDRQATQPTIEAQLPTSKGQKNNQNGTVPKAYYSQNGHLDYNLDSSTYARIQSSWLTQTGFQSSRFPDRTPSYLQASSHVPPPPSHSSPVFPHQAQPVQPYQLSSASTYHRTVPPQGPSLWADAQTDWPFFWGGTGPRVPWTQPSVSERPGWGQMQQGVEERVETCTGSSPKEELRGDERWRRDSSNNCSQELDIKPVRLSSGHGESSSVTSTASSQASRKSSRNRNKEERRGTAGHRSTDEEGSCQHAAAIASASVDQSTESDGSLEISNGRSRRSVGQSVTPSRRAKEKNGDKNRSKRSNSRSQTESTSFRTESRSQSEEPVSQISGNQSPRDQSVRESVSCIQESESVNTRTGEDDGDTEDTVSKKSISAEQRSVAEDEGEKGKEEETGEEDSNVDDEYLEENKERSEQEEDQEGEDDEGEGFVRESLPENDGECDEEETEGHGSEGESEDGERSDEESVEKDYSATTQDREMEGDRCVESEESREGEEDDISDEGEGGAEEEERRSGDVGKDSEAAEPEERDSDSDSIISPQNHRSKRNIHTIPEEVEEIVVGDDNGRESQKDSSNELSDEADDIEYLLAPQTEWQKSEETVQKGSDKPKVTCEDLSSFSEQRISEIKEAQDTDSDEFDHFYD